MALAALSGLVILGETIGLRAIIAIGLIVLASSGDSFKRKILSQQKYKNEKRVQ